MQSKRLITSAVAVAALLATACGGATPSTASSSPSPSAAIGATTIAVASNALGQILVDGKGMTVYLFVADHTATSTCYSSCAQLWPPVLTNAAPVGGTGATASLLGTTMRTDWKTEGTSNDHPLYHFAPHKTHCDNPRQRLTYLSELYT